FAAGVAAGAALAQAAVPARMSASRIERGRIGIWANLGKELGWPLPPGAEVSRARRDEGIRAWRVEAGERPTGGRNEESANAGSKIFWSGRRRDGGVPAGGRMGNGGGRLRQHRGGRGRNLQTAARTHPGRDARAAEPRAHDQFQRYTRAAAAAGAQP